MTAPNPEEQWFVADVEKGLVKLPPHLQAGLRRYLVNRVRPGAFLQAVIRNDLAQAILRADENSLPGLRDILLFLHNCAPAPSHGSSEAIESWLSPASGERD